MRVRTAFAVAGLIVAALWVAPGAHASGAVIELDDAEVDPTGYYDDTLRATVTDAGVPLAGVYVAFSEWHPDNQSRYLCSALTDAAGVAACADQRYGGYETLPEIRPTFGDTDVVAYVNADLYDAAIGRLRPLPHEAG